MFGWMNAAAVTGGVEWLTNAPMVGEFDQAKVSALPSGSKLVDASNISVCPSTTFMDAGDAVSLTTGAALPVLVIV